MIIRLWWLSQWLVTHVHHLPVVIYLRLAPSPGRHKAQAWKLFTGVVKVLAAYTK